MNAETNAKTPHNLILGEIDIHQSHKQNFLSNRDDMPAKSIDYACLYGPWIADRGNYGVQSSHGTYFEIHPSEQIWWTEKLKLFIAYCQQTIILAILMMLDLTMMKKMGLDH